MRKAEYDFLTWKSFPSSAKIWIDELEGWALWPRWLDSIAVRPEASVKVQVFVKQHNVLGFPSHILMEGYNQVTGDWQHILPDIWFPKGSFNWTLHEHVFAVPANVVALRLGLRGGGGGITWYDDLKIYQDDVLIYSNDFSNWNPYVGAGAGGIGVSVPAYLYTKNIPVAVGAGVIGTLIGTIIGYLTPTP